MSASAPSMTEVRNYVDNIRYIRRPTSELGAYENLISHCFNAFNFRPERLSVHFHFRRNTICEGLALLEEIDWDAGVFDNDKEFVLYAHFVTRLPSENDTRRGYRARESTTPSDGSSPESPWVQPPLPSVDDQGLVAPGDQSADPVPDIPGSAPTAVSPPAPLQLAPAVRRPVVRQPATQRRNTNSTTAISLCTPIPTTRYGTAAYYSRPYIFIPLPPSLPRPRSHPQRYSDPFPGFRTQLAAPTTRQTTTATASTPARRRPSAPAAISSRSLAPQPRLDDGFPDRAPVTTRGRPRTGEQTVRLQLPVTDRFDFPLEFDDDPPARYVTAPRRRAEATEYSVLPPPTVDPFDFPLDFNDGSVLIRQPLQLHHGEQEQELDEDNLEVPEEEAPRSASSSLESFEFPLEVDDWPPASQQPRQEELEQEAPEQEAPEQEGRVSVARSEDSFRQFVAEEIESPLFVTDESDRDFNEDLAWETDDKEEQNQG